MGFGEMGFSIYLGTPRQAKRVFRRMVNGQGEPLSPLREYELRRYLGLGIADELAKAHRKASRKRRARAMKAVMRKLIDLPGLGMPVLLVRQRGRR